MVLEEMLERLLDPETNVYYIAIVLRFIANELGVKDIFRANKSEIIRIIARYNGLGPAAMKYGQEVFTYYKAFQIYFNN